jgi:uncharacterized protein YeaO (DUF488 family)
MTPPSAASGTRDTIITGRVMLIAGTNEATRKEKARMKENRITIKRVYQQPEDQDGKRILVDRLWPRGLTKEKARVDLWLKEIAPSTELRKWFGHDPERWTDFQKRYRAELKKNAETVLILKEEIDRGPVTLLYGAKDKNHNEAVVLQSILKW